MCFCTCTRCSTRLEAPTLAHLAHLVAAGAVQFRGAHWALGALEWRRPSRAHPDRITHSLARRTSSPEMAAGGVVLADQTVPEIENDFAREAGGSASILATPGDKVERKGRSLGVVDVDEREPRGRDARARHRARRRIAAQVRKLRPERGKAARLEIRAHRVGAGNAVVLRPAREQRHPFDGNDLFLLVALEQGLGLEKTHHARHGSERRSRGLGERAYAIRGPELAEGTYDPSSRGAAQVLCQGGFAGR